MESDAEVMRLSGMVTRWRKSSKDVVGDDDRGDRGDGGNNRRTSILPDTPSRSKDHDGDRKAEEVPEVGVSQSTVAGEGVQAPGAVLSTVAMGGGR